MSADAATAIDHLLDGRGPEDHVAEVLPRDQTEEEIDEALVRRLTFPRERSLEVVRDAVLDRDLDPLLDLVAAASSGAPVNNWQGQRLEPGGLGPILFAQVTNLEHQMLYLRRVAAGGGLERDMAPDQTSRRGWYAGRFKKDLAPDLLARLKQDAPSPMIRPGSPDADGHFAPGRLSSSLLLTSELIAHGQPI